MNKKTILSCLIFITGAAFIGAEPCDASQMEKKQLCSSIVVGECSRGLNFNIGLIAERISMSGTEVASVETSATADYEGGGTGLVYDDCIRNINFNLDVGLRIGLSYLVDHDDWMATAAFEWISSKGSVYQDTANGGTIFPYDLPSPFYGVDKIAFSDVSAALKVQYYLLDIQLSKGVFFSKHFSYEPFAGIKASWIGYNADQQYSAVDQDPMTSGTSFMRNTKVNFWGVGPMAGLNSNYFVVAGWSIFSSANVSVLLGEADTSNYIRLVPTGNGGYQPEKASVNQTVICPTMRTMLGLQYDCQGYNESQNVVARIGFDGRYYFNQYPYLGYTAVAKSITNPLSGQLDSNPTIRNNAFGMIGLIADLVWHF
jgi:hypothetical protein